MASYTYSFEDVTATIVGPGGGFTIGGQDTFSADEGIKITFNEDKGSLQTGADGNWMHNLHAANAGTIEVTLLKNSPINQLLNALYDAQRSAGSLWGQNTITIVNITSGDLYTCEGVGFKKFADNGYAKDGATLTWPFNAGRLDPKLGSGV